MNRKFISILLVFLFITSVSIPAVSAQGEGVGISALPVAAVPAILAVPATSVFAEISLDGVVDVIVASAAVIGIGKYVDNPWEKAVLDWDKFVQDVSARLASLFGNSWTKVTSSQGQSEMASAYEGYVGGSGGSSGGKKDDKVYYEARLVKNPKTNQWEVEFNTKKLDINQAVQKIKEGKDIMTLNKKCADDLLERYGLNPKNLKPERHPPKPGLTEDDMFDHYNIYNIDGKRLHLWFWKIE